MKFGAVPVAQAEGCILAHSIGLPDRRLKKGRLLRPTDLAALAAAGIADVTVARIGAADIPEDEAAARIAAALCSDAAGHGLTVSAPFTGRANVFAAQDGVLTVEAAQIHDLNAVDPSLTLATLPPMTRVTARQMVATVKVIPYAAPASAVARSEALLTGDALAVHGFAARDALLILTRTPGMKPALLTKGADAVRARLSALGISNVTERIVDHSVTDLCAAMTEQAGGSALTLILTGSATSDREDVGPAAVAAAGGTISRFGMPVDPGNLLFLGDLAGRPVIGLPGCARSPKLNGADWVLERLAAGLNVTDGDIAAMGVGGLLKEIPSRPEPRSGGALAPHRPKIAIAILAAGSSTRMRGRDKLLEEVGAKPLLAHVAQEAEASQADHVLCVLNTTHVERRAVLSGRSVRTVENPVASQGMATSIAAAIAALPSEVDAVILMLGDMPEITAADLDRLIAAFEPAENRAIVRSVSSDGIPGHPVLFGRRFFEALAALDCDRGARPVLDEHPDFIADVVLDHDRALIDLDTPEAWAAWRAGTG